MPKTKHRVHFQWLDSLVDEQQEAHAEISPPIKKTKSPINFNKLKLQILDLFRKDQYELLLPAFIKEVLPTSHMQHDFFNAQGHNVLAFLLAYKHDMKALNLIKQLFSSDFKSAIKKEDFMCLEKFLIAQSSKETFLEDDDFTRNLRKEKFKFLLAVDYLVVKDYFHNADQRYFTAKMQADFLHAIQETDQYKNTLKL